MEMFFRSPFGGGPAADQVQTRPRGPGLRGPKGWDGGPLRQGPLRPGQSQKPKVPEFTFCVQITVTSRSDTT